MANLTTIILTKNEEMNIKNCIQSVQNVSKRIIVIDSFSSDLTVEIAKSLGAEVYQNEFVNYGNQFQYALDNTNIKTQWVFRFDADERLTKESSSEIEKLCFENRDTDINGIIFKLEVNFLGRKLKHGGTYPFKKLCIFKTGHAFMETRSMDEQIVLLNGKAIEMKSISEHKDYRDLTYWISKHNWYATRAAKDYLDFENEKIDYNNLDFSAKIRRFLKYKLYYKMPQGTRSLIYFIYRYIIKLGFLDGKEGYYYAFFQAYWYRVLVDAKIFEAKKNNTKIDEAGSLN
ncbi:glycosyltransferase family 2 protein [Carnobacterium sp.]|uniref:glycosyltransferase family 2 protein n=1 Tax=Carnobacterium sp. TaxID=48221 RepID=UPI0028A74AD3|nr:glycosyltransferase family 2 protein [Carnobacterium sp.]